MDSKLRAALYHIISVWLQYASLEHRFCSAGESACDFLAAHGLGEDDGYSFVLNDAGKELLRQGDQLCIDSLVLLPESLDERRELQRQDYIARGCFKDDIQARERILSEMIT